MPGGSGKSPRLRIRQGAYLPHWTREGGTYSTTFRLADSLPKHIRQSWELERQHIVARAAQMERELTDIEMGRLKFLYSERVQEALDAGHGASWMNNPRIAELVQGALHFFDDQRYHLIAWCVMPNHVHAVFRPIAPHDLPDILHSWKGFTSTQANKTLQRKGTFWHAETYDHLIRDDEDLAHAINYVLQNPAKAGLKDWPWVGRKP
jgi:menaquinone-specific isochorismate synthase